MDSEDFGLTGGILLICGFVGWFIPDRLQTWAIAVGACFLVLAAIMRVFEIRTTNSNRGEQ